MVAISYYLTVINIFHKSIYIYAEMNGYLFTIISLILGIIISVLLGMYVALLLFRINIKSDLSKKNGLIGTLGVGAGIIASGCPSCGVPLLGLVGLPLGLVYLPFKGIELKIISIIFILVSIYYISKNIKKSLECDLKKQN